MLLNVSFQLKQLSSFLPHALLLQNGGKSCGGLFVRRSPGCHEALCELSVTLRLCTLVRRTHQGSSGWVQLWWRLFYWGAKTQQNFQRHRPEEQVPVWYQGDKNCSTWTVVFLAWLLEVSAGVLTVFGEFYVVNREFEVQRLLYLVLFSTNPARGGLVWVDEGGDKKDLWPSRGFSGPLNLPARWRFTRSERVRLGWMGARERSFSGRPE